MISIDYEIKLVDEWNFLKNDLIIIKRDWEFIQQKIMQGKAHELSEGDTFYLGACTKGTNSNELSGQPFSDIKAKRRAFSFKQGYVNHIIASISNSSESVYGRIIDFNEQKEYTIEEIVENKFKEFYGKSLQEIIQHFQIKLNLQAKNIYASITKLILGISLDKKIEEFEKAGIIVKTVRLNRHFMPKEDISFKSFRYIDFKETDWENSDFKENLEQKFLFVFYQLIDNTLILKRVKFWNMPYSDILEAEKVWNRTAEIVKTGQIVKEIKTLDSGKIQRLTNFPDKKFSNVAHVRPHAKDSNDVFELIVPDLLTGLNSYTKHCFWLNNSYVKQIFLND